MSLPGSYAYRDSNTRIWLLCISENGRSWQWKVWAGEILEHLLRLVISGTNRILYRRSSACFVSGLLPDCGQSCALWKTKYITIYLWQRTIAPAKGRWWGCTGSNPCPLVYISSHSRVTSLPVGRKSILTPPLHILYIFWHLHNTKTWLPFPIPCSILSVDPFWEVQGIIYLQLYDPAILGFLAGQYPLVSCIIGSFQTIDLS